MLNFRKLKQDFSPSIVKEGRELYDKGTVLSAKIVSLHADHVRLSCRVLGSFDNTYQCEVEIDLNSSSIRDSDCDCTYKYDCQHLAATLFYLEEHYNELVVAYSKEADVEQTADEEEKQCLLETIKEAETQEVLRKGKKYQKELLQEYIGASQVLGQSPFFLAEEEVTQDKAELAIIFSNPSQPAQDLALSSFHPELQIALRLPFRSKPLIAPNVKEFLDSVRYGESMYIGSKRYCFSLQSFDQDSAKVLKFLLENGRFFDAKSEKSPRITQIEAESFGTILALAHDLAQARPGANISRQEQEETCHTPLPCLFFGSLEEPLRFSNSKAVLRFELEYLESPAPSIFLKPTLLLDNSTMISVDAARLFECAQPGMIYHNTYYSFAPEIKRKHLRHLTVIRNMAIPEPLFGTFVENSLPELHRYAQVANREILERFVTLPFVEDLQAECDINYLNGELEASLNFLYGKIKVPAAASLLKVDDITRFVTKDGILARSLTEEQKIVNDLFQDFIFDQSQGVYISKNDKKIVEFMTEVIPRYQNRVQFQCPENLLDQFVYDDTVFKLRLRETEQVDVYEVDVQVDGQLNGISLELLWECISSKRAFIELVAKKTTRRKTSDAKSGQKVHKILVLDLDRLAPVVQIFDEIGITSLENHKDLRPLWSLASLDAAQFEGLPIEFSMTEKLQEIQQQMMGLRAITPSDIPNAIQAKMREYQVEGVHWLERLRTMHLNGILADDMGLGKTLQAITALTQHKLNHPKALAIVVCPTSLVYNWKEEFGKFNPKLRVLPVDGTPAQRKKLLNDIRKYDVIITSYSLLQKDIEFYKTIRFDYSILDEAQHIKNRGTRNAKSVKMIEAAHRLILTGTPIENSLDELWSLFDFLMPGLLSSYDRFVEKYIRAPGQTHGSTLDNLRRKLSPFILRRMKKDVLDELPDISEIVYHCHLSEKQREFYTSYAESAREELSLLVQKEGFDRVQIHVLATLTRLKQICCHPAIFAKDRPEVGDSAKYDMLMELMHTLIEGQHKTVIFSQYTRMLNIMREDLQQQGIRFEYLDGTSKNRLGIVKKFNEDPAIPVFLVSLKAGGTGLNLVGADTVIHYDMWWNPAVENQATDRVHRIGQKQSVSSYKLVTLNTIEEKILDLQNRKRGLVKQVITSDEEAITKLTWEEVLELLQT